MAGFHFYGWVLFHCIHIPYLLYPFICWWTPQLLLYFGYCKQCLLWTLGCSVFFLNSCFFLFKYTPRSGIAGSFSNFTSSFLRNFHSVYIRVVPIYISTESVQGLPFLHTLANICYLCSFSAIQTSVWWYLTVVLICISGIISDVELCMFSMEKCLFKYSAHFWLGLFVFGYCIVWAVYFGY